MYLYSVFYLRSTSGGDGYIVGTFQVPPGRDIQHCLELVPLTHVDGWAIIIWILLEG